MNIQNAALKIIGRFFFFMMEKHPWQKSKWWVSAFRWRKFDHWRLFFLEERMIHPATADKSDPASTDSFASSSSKAPLNERPAMKMDIVKPMPAVHPAPNT